MFVAEERSPFALWLQVQLRVRRLSLRQLAERSGLSHSTLSRILRGGHPSLETAARIVRALGKPDTAVVTLAGRPAPASAWPRREVDPVERALRAHPILAPADIERILALYRELRTRREAELRLGGRVARVAGPGPAITRNGPARDGATRPPATDGRVGIRVVGRSEGPTGEPAS